MRQKEWCRREIETAQAYAKIVLRDPKWIKEQELRYRSIEAHVRQIHRLT
jgi:hypothetical protein